MRIAQMRRSRGFSATAENFLFSYFLANTTVTNDDDIELSTVWRPIRVTFAAASTVPRPRTDNSIDARGRLFVVSYCEAKCQK